jgi:excisionase family DNA binding protein
LRKCESASSGSEEGGGIHATNETKPAPAPPTQEVNGPAAEVLTLGEAAAYLWLPEADVLRLVDEQGLPGRRLANEWRFLKAAIQQWLSTPPPRYSKEAQLAVIGSWKDDPLVEEELKEVMRQRGRPVPEEES